MPKLVLDTRRVDVITIRTPEGGQIIFELRHSKAGNICKVGIEAPAEYRIDRTRLPEPPRPRPLELKYRRAKTS